MNDPRSWFEAHREYLRITGPVYSDMDAFSTLFTCDEEYRQAIVRAADGDKAIPRKLTAEDRKRHRKAASEWINAMKLWAKNMRRYPLPGKRK